MIKDKTWNWVTSLRHALAKWYVARSISAHKDLREIFALVGEKAEVEQLTRPGLIIDRPTLDRYFESIQSRIGHVPCRMGSRFSQAVALRFAKRLGRKYAGKIDIPSGVLTDAWSFAIWTEL